MSCEASFINHNTSRNKSTQHVKCQKKKQSYAYIRACVIFTSINIMIFYKYVI